MNTPLPKELAVFIHGSSVPLCILNPANLHQGQSLLGACQEHQPGCDELSSQAWFEVDEHGSIVPADVQSPAAAVLASCPCQPHRLVYASNSQALSSRQPSPTQPINPLYEPCHSSHEQPQNSRGTSRWKKWGGRLGKLLVTGIKVTVVAEAASFVLGRARLLRYLGRHERWGPSSDAATDENDVGTSSEAADLLLDYMQDEVGIEALQGFTPEQIDRALNKINSEDLEELGVKDAHEQLALIRATVKEAEKEQGQPSKASSSTGRINPGAVQSKSEALPDKEKGLS